MTYRTAPTPGAKLRAALLSALFLASFIVSVVLTVLLVYAIVAWFFRLYHPEWFSGWHRMWCKELFKNLCVPTSLVMFLGAAHRIHELSGPDAARELAESFGGRRLRREDCHSREAEVIDIAEDVARKAGLPAMPAVYILGNDGSINAFAAEEGEGGMLIGITRGAVEALEPEELRALIAHECVHLRSGDSRLNIRLAGFLHGILLFSLIGMWFFRTAFRGRGRGFRGGGQIMMVLVLVAGALVVAGVVGRFIGQLLQLALSRQREYHADAAAIEIAGSPRGLAGALKKIGGWSEGSVLESFDVQGVNHFFFADGLQRRVLGLLSSHPDLNARIRRIQPNWHGVFRPVSARRDESWEQDLALRRLGGDDPLAARERDGQAGWMRRSVVKPPPPPICPDPLPLVPLEDSNRPAEPAGIPGARGVDDPLAHGAQADDPPPLPSGAAASGEDPIRLAPAMVDPGSFGNPSVGSRGSAPAELHSMIMHFPSHAGGAASPPPAEGSAGNSPTEPATTGAGTVSSGVRGFEPETIQPPPSPHAGSELSPPALLGIPPLLESNAAAHRPGVTLLALAMDANGPRRAAQIDALLPRLGAEFAHEIDAAAFEVDTLDTADRLDAVDRAMAELQMLPPDAWSCLLDALAVSIRAAGAVTGFRFCLHLMAVHEQRKAVEGWSPAGHPVVEPVFRDQAIPWIAVVAKSVSRRSDQFQHAYAQGLAALGWDPTDHAAPPWESVSLKGAGKAILGLAELDSRLRQRVVASCLRVCGCGESSETGIWGLATTRLLDPGDSIRSALSAHPVEEACVRPGAEDSLHGHGALDRAKLSLPQGAGMQAASGCEVSLIRKATPLGSGGSQAPELSAPDPTRGTILDKECPGCRRQGFRWARSTCSYCGIEIDADFSEERARRDALLGKELLAQEQRRSDEGRRERASD